MNGSALERGFAKRVKLPPNFRDLISASNTYPRPPPIAAGDTTFSDTNMQLLCLGNCSGSGPNNTIVTAHQSIFYIRPEVRRLWTFLDGNLPTISIVGSPGSGKSTAVLRHAFDRDTVANPHRFLYLRGVHSSVFVVWFRVSTQQYEYVRISDYFFRYFLDFFGSLLKENSANSGLLTFDTLIVDGFNSDIHEQVHSEMVFYPNIRFIRCISWQIQSIHADVQSARRIFKHIFAGWSENDYRAAARDGCFPFLGTVDTVMMSTKMRYYYAGSNARMFAVPGQYWEDHVISEINDTILSLSSVIDLDIYAAQRANKSVFALYSVDSHFNVTICSEFISKLLASRASQAFIASARGHIPSNPRFQEWVTKLEALNFMQSSVRFQLWDVAGNVRFWGKNAEIPSVWFVDHLDSAVASETLISHRFYFSYKWNQATFDGVHLEDLHTANFFNVTDAVTHSFKGTELYYYVTVLGIHRLHFFYILRRQGRIGQFVLPTVKRSTRAGIIARLEVNKRVKLSRAIFDALMENICGGILSVPVRSLAPAVYTVLLAALNTASLAAARSLAGTYTAAARQAALPGIQGTLLAAVTGAFQVALALPVLTAAQTTALQAVVRATIVNGYHAEGNLGAVQFNFEVLSYKQ